MSLYANQHGERDDRGRRIGTIYEPADFMPNAAKPQQNGVPDFDVLATAFANRGERGSPNRTKMIFHKRPKEQQ